MGILVLAGDPSSGLYFYPVFRKMQNSPQRLVVLGTGGTIAGTAEQASDHTGYTAAQLGITELLARVPGLDASAIETEQVAQLDSKDMDHATWQRLARRVAHHLARNDVQGVLVTHGTDTLEETAYFLHRVLAPAKPVVLCAAMRPATALQADGPQNLLDAVAVARTPGAAGVLAVLAGRVIGAADLRKLHPYRLDAFGAGDAGDLGQVEQGCLRRFRDWPAAPRHPGADRLMSDDPATWPWVALVTSHAGADARQVDALLAAGVHGLVVAATGNGTVHQALAAALSRAAAQGVAVVRSSRCALGALVGDGSDTLLQTGRGGRVPPLAGAGALTPVQARIELMLALTARA
jgi:L-asparaginase